MSEYLAPFKKMCKAARAKSIFRYGFDHLRSIFLNLDESQADFFQSLQFLSCT